MLFPRQSGITTGEALLNEGDLVFTNTFMHRVAPAGGTGPGAQVGVTEYVVRAEVPGQYYLIWQKHDTARRLTPRGGTDDHPLVYQFFTDSPKLNMEDPLCHGVSPSQAREQVRATFDTHYRPRLLGA